MNLRLLRHRNYDYRGIVITKIRLSRHHNFELLCTFRDIVKLRVIENTYEGTYDLCDSSKIHLRDHPSREPFLKPNNAETCRECL